MKKLEEVLWNKINLKTKPIGSLGKLEKLAFQLGMIQQTDNPRIEKPHILVFAADHGLANEGISPFPKEVTSQMVMNFLQGGAAINVFSRQHNIALKVVDAGVDFEFGEHENLIHSKIRQGSRNMLNEPAMLPEECRNAMEKGKAHVKNLARAGCNTVGFGEMGIGNTSSAALLMHKFCGLPLEDCVGRGTGHDEKGLQKKVHILTQVVGKHKVEEDPHTILATFGGIEIAMMAGAMLQAAEEGMVILIDGFIATSAVLASHALNDELLKNCIFCHVSDEKGHQLMLNFLKADPILNMGMCLGEGSGVALAFPLVCSASNFLNEMASFESAGVSNKE